MLKLFLFIGLIGAILMYTGDMVLYFSRNTDVSPGTVKDIIDIMKKQHKNPNKKSLFFFIIVV